MTMPIPYVRSSVRLCLVTHVFITSYLEHSTICDEIKIILTDIRDLYLTFKLRVCYRYWEEE